MPKIKNKYYREFLDGGFISYVEPEKLDQIMDNIPTKHKKEARALVIAHYLSGARPSEILQFKAQVNIYKKDQYVYIFIDKPTKRGLPRKIPLQINKRNPVAKYARELYDYSESLFPDMVMFPSFVGNYQRDYKRKNGTETTYKEVGYKLRYHFYKWSKPVFEGGLNIYFLRHNRFSSLAENGAPLEHIRLIKGSRTMAGVMPYSHMSQKEMRKVGRLIK